MDPKIPKMMETISTMTRPMILMPAEAVSATLGSGEISISDAPPKSTSTMDGTIL